MSTIAEQLQEAADKASQASAQAGLWATGPVGTTVPTDSGPVPTISEFTRAAQERADDAIDALGWVLAGDFTAGCTVTDRNQYVLVVGGPGYRWDGVLPKVVAPGSSPTPIATGAWVLVGDATLRGDLAATGGAGLVGDLPAFVTATEYAGGASTASTNNDAAITAAINDAIATGSYVYWPAVYEVQGNIPNFHSVRHDGPGGIKRGAYTFSINQKIGVHTIFVSPSGSSVNDGLTPSYPLKTLQQAFDILDKYGPVLDGNWAVSLAAGTYDMSSGSQTFKTPSKNRVLISGPSVGGHPNVPLAIIDGGGVGAPYSHGLNCDGPGVYVQVQDIKAQNFSELTGSYTRIGVLSANGADVYTKNVHTTSCSWAGIYDKECNQARHSGGIVDATGAAYGFVSDSTRCSFGYAAGSISGGPVVKNALSAGVYWSTGSQGHCDFVTFMDNSVAFLCAENSRCDTVGNDYKRNIVAKRSLTGGWFASGGAAETFNDGTSDANTTNLEFKAYSGDISELSAQGSGSWQRLAFDRTNRSASGAVTSTLATIYTIPPRRLVGVGKAIRYYGFGAITSASAGSSFTVNFGGMSLALTLPAAVAAPVTFEIEATLFELAGGYRAIGKISQGLNLQRLSSAASGFLANSSQPVSVSVTLTGAGDSVNLYRSDIFSIG